MNEMQRGLIKEMAEVKRVRDELRLQAHLARAEAKDLWVRLENAWPRLESRLRDLERESGEAAEQLAKATKELLTELKDGYRSLSQFR